MDLADLHASEKESGLTQCCLFRSGFRPERPLRLQQHGSSMVLFLSFS